MRIILAGVTIALRFSTIIARPSVDSSLVPTAIPSAQPSSLPTEIPSSLPNAIPALTLIPTLNPTTSTSSHPTVVPNCSAATEGELPYLGDGWCDAKYNSIACNYDNGDCCGKSCISFSYHCGSNGYTCIDPAYMNIPSSQPTNIRPTGSPTLYQIAPMVSIPISVLLSRSVERFLTFRSCNVTVEFHYYCVDFHRCRNALHCNCYIYLLQPVSARR